MILLAFSDCLATRKVKDELPRLCGIFIGNMSAISARNIITMGL